MKKISLKNIALAVMFICMNIFTTTCLISVPLKQKPKSILIRRKKEDVDVGAQEKQNEPRNKEISITLASNNYSYKQLLLAVGVGAVGALSLYFAGRGAYKKIMPMINFYLNHSEWITQALKNRQARWAGKALYKTIVKTKALSKALYTPIVEKCTSFCAPIDVHPDNCGSLLLG